MDWKRDKLKDEEILKLLDLKHLIVSELIHTINEEGITKDNEDKYYFYQEILLEIDNCLDDLHVFDVSK